MGLSQGLRRVISLANATAPLTGAVFEASSTAYSRGAAASNAVVDEAIASLQKRLPGDAAADVARRAGEVTAQVRGLAACMHVYIGSYRGIV